MRCSPGICVGRRVEPPLFQSPPWSSGCDLIGLNEFRVAAWARSTQKLKKPGAARTRRPRLILLRGNLCGLPSLNSTRGARQVADGFSPVRRSRYSTRDHHLTAHTSLSMVSRTLVVGSARSHRRSYFGTQSMLQLEDNGTRSIPFYVESHRTAQRATMGLHRAMLRCAFHAVPRSTCRA